jgi:hypothetical protein
MKNFGGIIVWNTGAIVGEREVKRVKNTTTAAIPNDAANIPITSPKPRYFIFDNRDTSDVSSNKSPW